MRDRLNFTWARREIIARLLLLKCSKMISATDRRPAIHSYFERLQFLKPFLEPNRDDVAFWKMGPMLSDLIGSFFLKLQKKWPFLWFPIAMLLASKMAPNWPPIFERHPWENRFLAPTPMLMNPSGWVHFGGVGSCEGCQKGREVERKKQGNFGVSNIQ